MSIDDSSSISGIARHQQAVSVDGSLEEIFEPDGSLRPAKRIVEMDDEEPQEAWLEAVAPDRLATIDERVDELPTDPSNYNWIVKIARPALRFVHAAELYLALDDEKRVCLKYFS